MELSGAFLPLAQLAASLGLWQQQGLCVCVCMCAHMFVCPCVCVCVLLVETSSSLTSGWTHRLSSDTLVFVEGDGTDSERTFR